MALAQEQVGLLAMGLDCDLNKVSVHRYRVIVESGLNENESQAQQSRKAARLTSIKNNWQPVTDAGLFLVVTLQPLEILNIEIYGFKCTLEPEGEGVLEAAKEGERAAIERLLNQDLYRAALSLAKDRNPSHGRALKASRNSSGWVELEETNPSDRVSTKAAYLDLFKTLRLIPELLPCGKVILGLTLRHKICARDGITVDWVINKRPEWLTAIKRVRHRYTDHGRPRGVAHFHGVANDKTVNSAVPGMPHTLYSYHEEKGHIPPGQAQSVRASHVVKVSYGRKDRFDHLGALLEPMFDFETLQKIDSPLLNRMARDLKWPIIDRLQASAGMVKGLRLPGFGTKVVPVTSLENAADNICPPFSLTFHNGRTSDTEKAVLALGAFRGMTRSQVVCLAVGTSVTSDVLSRHFYKLRESCQRLSAGPLPKWLGMTTPKPLKDAQELDKRLADTPPENTLLVVAIDRSVDKATIRDVAFRHKLACQFMLTDHNPKTYQNSYYNNLAAGVFSKGGGLICGLGEMPGEVDLFIGLDMGGVSQRAPGSAFLFTCNGAQLGWQLADLQSGERLEDEALKSLLHKSIQEYRHHHNGEPPRKITIHRDGRFFESLEVIRDIEQQYDININVLEVIKSGAPILFRKYQHSGQRKYRNPEVGDVYRYVGLDELILATYSGQELGVWGEKVSVRPLRLRKRYGKQSLDIMAQQVLLLSRIHGASLYRHPRLPVTTHHADRFATLRQSCSLDALSHMDRACPVYL
ncbi:Piwi domain-containing protein [Marinobacter sp. MDS2]|uniref:Piwi domain-containing protein n=1 Tax=Marinobacter sp. MDS2 TaxID=3065961 RepID=UPI00273B76AD|nr:Piwi domain-containing protein [Marinobacter sp. MDS2]MDP4548699.1 Piwi domain-containing protein [Marinobacter sp. MDS2]